MTILVYDGSLQGLLTSIFEVYERKLSQVNIVRDLPQADAFAAIIHIETDVAKAGRVWEGLKKKLSREGISRFYNCHLSEIEGMENTLLQFARHAFSATANIEEDFSNAAVLTVAQTARKVWREKHRMEAFVRFQLVKGDLFYASIEPDHNVLPLILPHFKSRYADQNWLIYDLRRHYGIYYNKTTEKVDEVTLEWKDGIQGGIADSSIFEPEEEEYQKLWKDYFRHTGIPERRNMKLHIQHIPRRYWRYLTEKQ